MNSRSILAAAFACQWGGCDSADPPVPTTIAISPASATLRSLGETVQLTASVRDQYGQAMAGVDIAWSGSDTSVAAFNPAGLVTAVRNGTFTVTASVGEASATAGVTIMQEIAAVSVSPPADTLMALEDTVRFVPEARDGNGNVVEGAGFVWASSDTSVATIDSAGLVTAIRNGSLGVTASAGSVSATAQVRVEQRVASVFVIPEAFRLIRRGSVQASAEAEDANGHPIPGVSFAWSSTGTAVTTVDESGLIAATGLGSASVVASSGEVESAAEITVVVPPPVRSVETSPVPTNGGIHSGGGTWELPADEVFTVTLRSRGNAGYDFVHWTEDVAIMSTDSASAVQVAANHRISAHFTVNREYGRWGPANTYSTYQFPDTAYESLAWTYLPVVDPPESLREKDLLHFYAYQFLLLNSTSAVGSGYAGFQSDGHLETDDGDRWGKVVNFAIWGSDSAITDGLVNPDNEECGCHQIMLQYEWVEGRKYRFELTEGPSGEEDEGKWWGLWVTDLATDSTTFVGEQRMQTEIGGEPSVLLRPYTVAFGEDTHWWHSLDGTGKYICSDFEASSVAILDVTAGEDEEEPTRVRGWTNSGSVAVGGNGHRTTLCHVTVFQDGSGNVQHNVGYWPEPPRNVLEGDNRPP